MKTTRRLSKAYDARIERLTNLLRLRTEWERKAIIKRMDATC